MLAPTREAPITLAPGAPLDLEIVSATGLTPPPGLQEARAHRGLHASLCSAGVSQGAPARVCTALRIDDVRPRDAHSLVYRVRAQVEAWLGAGTYDLYVRYPGGEASVPGGVKIGAATTGRVHVGPEGLSALPDDAQVAPLPAPAGGFAPGFVAGAPNLAGPHAAGPLALRIEAEGTTSWGEVRVRVLGAPPDAHVFVRSQYGDSARGADVTLPARGVGSLALEALAVARDGRTGFAAGEAQVRPRLAFGCALAPRAGGPARSSLSLLVLVLSATLGRRRPSVARPGPGQTRPTRE